jgi:hypothetical protein
MRRTIAATTVLFFVVSVVSTESFLPKQPKSFLCRNGFRTTISKTMEWEAVDPDYSFDSIYTIDGRRMAKDQEYLTAVMTHWKEQQGPRLHVIERSPITYAADRDDQKQLLYGQLFRRVKESNLYNGTAKLPVILLFHTAAGPQDVFLYYKADILLQNFDCIVMICDILSDADGWAWDSDRTRYNDVKTK